MAARLSRFMILPALIAVVFVWMLPILLSGQMYDVPLMLATRNFASSGCYALMDSLGRFLSPSLLCSLGEPMPFDGRVSIVLFGWISQWIPFTNLVGWSFASCVLVALALLGWWIAIAHLFDRKIAWISSVILALMPFFWREAVWPDYYSVSYVFLAWSAVAYLLLRTRSEYLALAVAGALYGLTAGAKDVFLIFLPWIVVCYVYVNRSTLRKSALAIGIFIFCLVIVYLLPYAGDIRTLGYPVNYNLARLWPGAEELQEAFYLHLYPDPYTYLFNRDAFNAEFLTRYKGMSLLEQLRLQKSFVSFGFGESSIFLFLLNGAWLLLGALPTLFQQETMGGIFLWLFILPGIVLLAREKKSLIVFLVGFALSGELITRFVLHYARDHIMDYGWILALLAAVGIGAIASACAKSQVRISAKAISAFIVIIISLQLIQANRVVFARRYSRTFVPQVFSIVETVDATPEGSVIAMGIGASRIEQVAQASNRTIAMFDESTMRQLIDEGLFSDAMDLYEVTHVLGFSDDLNGNIQAHSPKLHILDVPTKSSVPHVTPFQNFLLHLVR